MTNLQTKGQLKFRVESRSKIHLANAEPEVVVVLTQKIIVDNEEEHDLEFALSWKDFNALVMDVALAVNQIRGGAPKGGVIIAPANPSLN